MRQWMLHLRATHHDLLDFLEEIGWNRMNHWLNPGFNHLGCSWICVLDCLQNITFWKIGFPVIFPETDPMRFTVIMRHFTGEASESDCRNVHRGWSLSDQYIFVERTTSIYNYIYRVDHPGCHWNHECQILWGSHFRHSSAPRTWPTWAVCRRQTFCAQACGHDPWDALCSECVLANCLETIYI